MSPKEKLEKIRDIQCPVIFEFEDKPFVVEIQYFYGNQFDLGNVEKGYLVFAATSDASDLLIKSDFSSDEVMQREFEGIDSINITLSDLIGAKHVYS